MRWVALLAGVIWTPGCQIVTKAQYEEDRIRLFGDDTGDTDGETGHTGETDTCDDGDAVALAELALNGADDALDADATLVGGVSYGGMGYDLRALGDLDGDGQDDFGIGTGGGVILGFGAPEAGADLVGFEGSFAAFQLDEPFVYLATSSYVSGLPRRAGDLDGDGASDLLIEGNIGFVSGADRHYPGLYLVLGPLTADMGGGDGAYDVADAVDAGQGAVLTLDDYRFWSGAVVDDLDGGGAPDLYFLAYEGFSAAAGLVTGESIAMGEIERDITSVAALTLSASRGRHLYEASVEEVGDLDGDGLIDAVLAAPKAEGRAGTEGEGAVWLLPNDALTLGDTLDVYDLTPLVQGDSGSTSSEYEGVGVAVAAVGDVDEDGLPDVLVGAPDGYEGVGIVVMGAGATTQVIGPPDSEGDGSVRYGTIVGAPGDVNGDCVPDLLVGSRSDLGVTEDHSGTATLLLGGSDAMGARFLTAADGVNIPLPATLPFNLTAKLNGLGDMNGDGYDDFALAAYAFDADTSDADESNEGGVFFFFGGP